MKLQTNRPEQVKNDLLNYGLDFPASDEDIIQLNPDIKVDTLSNFLGEYNKGLVSVDFWNKTVYINFPTVE